MKNVLILTASYGEGHNAAARGLDTAFRESAIADSAVLDPFREAYGALYDRSRRAYLEIIERAPRLWATIYGVLDHTPLIHLAMETMGPLERVLRREIRARRPDAIVSTYPVYSYAIERLFPREKGRPFHYSTVVTDSITVNSVWFREESDRYFVPNEDTAQVMKKAGVAETRLSVLGFPVLPRFVAERPERAVPGVGNRPKVLYMVNAARRKAPAVVRGLLALPEIDLAVAVGRDEALQSTMQEIAAETGRQIEVLGWVPNMPELLMTHHLLIGKAGGAAVQEAIAARTPMIITQVVPGQEEGNARLLLKHRCGIVAETPDAITAAVSNIFAGEAVRWRELEANIARISRPDAALRIAEAVVAAEPAVINV